MAPEEIERQRVYIYEGTPSVIYAQGELDYRNCSLLSDIIHERLDKEETVELALSDLDFVDSSGLRVLVKAATNAADQGRALKIVSLAPQLSHILDVSGFRPLFDLPAMEVAPAKHETKRKNANLGACCFRIPSDMASCRIARNEICSFAEHMGFGQADLDDIRLAVGEAVSNAVRHGNCAEDDDISVHCKSMPQGLSVTFSYPSLAFDPGSVPVPDSSCPEEGGMGIHFMRLVMDLVNYAFEDGMVTLTLEKHFSGIGN